MPAAPGKREATKPNKGDQRYVRRNEDGEFTESEDLNRSLSQDDRKDAEKTSKPGHGDKGDGPTGDKSGK